MHIRRSPFSQNCHISNFTSHELRIQTLMLARCWIFVNYENVFDFSLTSTCENFESINMKNLWNVYFEVGNAQEGKDYSPIIFVLVPKSS
jgi:hypothetical protein